MEEYKFLQLNNPQSGFYLFKLAKKNPRGRRFHDSLQATVDDLFANQGGIILQG